MKIIYPTIKSHKITIRNIPKLLFIILSERHEMCTFKKSFVTPQDH